MFSERISAGTIFVRYSSEPLVSEPCLGGFGATGVSCGAGFISTAPGWLDERHISAPAQSGRSHRAHPDKASVTIRRIASRENRLAFIAIVFLCLYVMFSERISAGTIFVRYSSEPLASEPCLGGFGATGVSCGAGFISTAPGWLDERHISAPAQSGRSHRAHPDKASASRRIASRENRLAFIAIVSLCLYVMFSERISAGTIFVRYSY